VSAPIYQKSLDFDFSEDHGKLPNVSLFRGNIFRCTRLTEKTPQKIVQEKRRKQEIPGEEGSPLA